MFKHLNISNLDTKNFSPSWIYTNTEKHQCTLIGSNNTMWHSDLLARFRALCRITHEYCQFDIFLPEFVLSWNTAHLYKVVHIVWWDWTVSILGASVLWVPRVWCLSSAPEKALLDKGWTGIPAWTHQARSELVCWLVGFDSHTLACHTLATLLWLSFEVFLTFYPTFYLFFKLSQKLLPRQDL